MCCYGHSIEQGSSEFDFSGVFIFQCYCFSGASNDKRLNHVITWHTFPIKDFISFPAEVISKNILIIFFRQLLV